MLQEGEVGETNPPETWGDVVGLAVAPEGLPAVGVACGCGVKVCGGEVWLTSLNPHPHNSDQHAPRDEDLHEPQLARRTKGESTCPKFKTKLATSKVFV